MKVFRIVRFVFFMLIFFACTMESAYIDGIEEKIAEDKADSSVEDEESYRDDVTLFITQAGDGSIDLEWYPSYDDDYEGIIISWSPDDDTTVLLPKGEYITYNISGLTNSTRYTVKAVAHYTTGEVSEGVEVSITLPTTSTDITSILYPSDLYNVRNDLSGYYVVVNDLDLSDYTSGTGWDSIGDPTGSFSGTFDGNGHTITNLVIDTTGTGSQGLFGGCSGTVSYLNLSSVEISALNTSAGALVGWADLNAYIHHCHISGNISGGNNVGGLVGYYAGNSILYCSVYAIVSGGQYVGGLTGYGGGPLSDCHFQGTVNASDSYSGGLIGYLSSAGVSSSYAMGTVNGSESSAGLIGSADSGIINYTYAAVDVNSTGSLTGGLLAESTGGTAVSYCYYDRDVSGITTGYGDSKTTAEMKTPTTFSAWSITDSWAYDAGGNNGYPYLRNWPPQD